MPTVFSEIIREAESDVREDEAFDVFDEFNSAREKDEVLGAGALLLQTHLTTSKPDSFQATGSLYGIVGNAYLSDKEISLYFKGLAEPFHEMASILQGKTAETAQDAADDIDQAAEEGATILTFGSSVPKETVGENPVEPQTLTDADAPHPPAWVIGTVLYTEPSDRLVGPEHRDLDPEEFSGEFRDRGGTYLVLGVPDRYLNRAAAALTHVADQHSDQ